MSAIPTQAGSNDTGDDDIATGQERDISSSSTLLAQPSSPRENGASSVAHDSAPKTLTILNGIAIVIGMQIGSGIFSAPAIVSQNVPSALVGTLMWLAAGALVWCGAACFAELGTLVPHNGGIQDYLRHGYGEVWGFIFSATWMAIIKPCSMAMISLIFAEYLYRSFMSDLSDLNLNEWILKLTALLAMLAVTMVNCLGTSAGTRTANLFLVIKLVGLGSIGVLGLFAHFLSDTSEHVNVSRQIKASQNNTQQYEAGTTWANVGNLTDAMFSALYAYGGWESISFMVGEMENPSQKLPIALHTAMAVVLTLFALSNMGLYSVISISDMSKTNAVALEFGSRVGDRLGMWCYSWIVSLSCFGALNATLFSLGRLTRAAAERRYLPAIFAVSADAARTTPYIEEGGIDRKRRFVRAVSKYAALIGSINDPTLPRNAMLLNTAVTSFYILIGSFRGLLTFKGMAEFTLFALTTPTMLILRRRGSSREPAPYQTSILTPVIFCGVATLITARSAVTHLIQAGLLLGFFTICVVIFKFWIIKP